MYIARQPIFNSVKNVYGYELLFRGNEASTGYDGTSDQQATASVITGLFESGIEKIVENKKAFVNFSNELIQMDFIELIDSDRLVVEVLEKVAINQELIDRIEYLSKQGYQIALDDFKDIYEQYPLVKHADIIKYDVMATPLNTIKKVVQKGLKERKIMLAEKIEREEEFEMAKEMGFTLFQGFFFSKPSIIGKENETKTTTKNEYMLLIRELQKKEPSYKRLAEIIGQDANLAHRFLRVISGRVEENSLDSIKRAMTYIGLKELERWIYMLMMQELGKDKPRELRQLSLIRSKFSEGLAGSGKLGKMKHEASLMGLFSTIDALTDSNMKEALEGIALSDTLRSALNEEDHGELADIVKMIKAYEKGEWQATDELAKQLHLDPKKIQDHYLKAVNWARNTMDLIA